MHVESDIIDMFAIIYVIPSRTCARNHANMNHTNMPPYWGCGTIPLRKRDPQYRVRSAEKPHPIRETHARKQYYSFLLKSSHPPKSTKLRKSDSSVSRGTNSN